jgi:hypothetical protein
MKSSSRHTSIFLQHKSANVQDANAKDTQTNKIKRNILHWEPFPPGKTPGGFARPDAVSAANATTQVINDYLNIHNKTSFTHIQVTTIL